MKSSDLFPTKQDHDYVKNICKLFNGTVVMCSTDEHIAYHNDPEGFAIKFNLNYSNDYGKLYSERDK